MPVLKLLLIPFALVYKAIMDIRNHLYDSGQKPSIQFDRFVVSVGNLTVGGTGKTPFVELLIRYFKSKYKIAVLSRGYGRKTRGFRLASDDDNASTLGDEPFQYQVKYGNDVTVAVGEERALAIPEILLKHEGIALIILDDAYQHRSVTPNLNILLNDYHRPFYRDRVMPAGLLRESRKHAKRANIVVVTKCPDDLGDSEMESIKSDIQIYAGVDTPVFFTGIRYLAPKCMQGTEAISSNIFLFSGIANPSPLVSYVKNQFNLIKHKDFPDHHAYTTKDVQQLIESFEESAIKDKSLLTTEKDMVRLLSMKERFLAKYPVFYLPIELYFLKNEDSFAKLLKTEIEQGIRDLGLKQ